MGELIANDFESGDYETLTKPKMCFSFSMDPPSGCLCAYDLFRFACGQCCCRVVFSFHARNLDWQKLNRGIILIDINDTEVAGTAQVGATLNRTNL